MLPIRLYNTLTHRVEDFTPLHPPRVTMYNCGPTVYDHAHIGNFRAFVFADVLRRFLELAGYQVHQVMNLTDVGHMTEDQVADGGGEDKMAAAARRLKEQKKQGAANVQNPDDPYQVAQFFIDSFLQDARSLQLKIASEYPQNMPRATEFIPQMQAMIRTLLDNGHAYVGGDGAVYFSVERFPDYGRLSGNTLDKIRGGAGGRVLDQHQAAKRHPADFLLWKPDPSHIMKWDSPWGAGYPGWHIECSAMARTKLASDVIDIHTGGEDNIFPHHECEIAQSCGCSGQAHFARHWLHTRFLLVDGQKMSKSKGNFYTVRQLIQQGADPSVIRFELLKSHYRSNMNFTLQSLEDDSRRRVERLRRLRRKLDETHGSQAADGRGREHPVVTGFMAALADDLNIAGALAEVDKWVGSEPGTLADREALECINAVLGLDLAAAGEFKASGEDSQITAKAAALDAARAAKDFATADRLRKELLDAGYEVTTSKQGTQVRKKLV